MKTNIILSALLAMFLGACHYPAFLPPPENVGVSPYGSYVTIFSRKAVHYDGELIAIDSNRIVILDESSNRCVTVPLTDLYNFKIRYATSSGYETSIPFFLALPFMHGWWSVFTIPIHLSVTIAVSVDARNEFVYKSTSMSYEKLRMFARFPQGVPAFIDLADIRR
jgi:hypothetical protein